MQDLTALFGADGATRYLELVAASYRQPCWELLALNEDGTTAMDLTGRLQRAVVEFTDEVGVSQKATFVFGNEDGYFDPYSGSPQSGLFIQGRILRYRKGLVDPVDGTRYLLPAYWGRIIRARFGYSDSGDVIAEMTLGDALKDAVRQKYTSPAYENTEANLIGADLLKRFGKFTDPRIQLAEVGHVYSFVQFPDFGLLDMLKTLYDPFLYWVRADESGNVTSGPRLGSALSGFSSVLGYPDQADAPPEDAVAFVFPDFPGVDTVEEEIQDYDGVYNQVRVLGKASTSLQSLGPSQILAGVQNSTIGSRDTLKKQYSFTDQVGDPKNAVVAQNVIVEFAYSTNHTIDTTPRFAYLSQLKWRGTWSATTTYAIGDAVSYSGSQYAANKGADSTHPPTDTEYWSELPFPGPYVQSPDIDNSDASPLHKAIGVLWSLILAVIYIYVEAKAKSFFKHLSYFNKNIQERLANSRLLSNINKASAIIFVTILISWWFIPAITSLKSGGFHSNISLAFSVFLAFLFFFLLSILDLGNKLSMLLYHECYMVFRLLRVLESICTNKSRWRYSYFRRDIAIEIERATIVIERMFTRIFYSGDPATDIICRKKAVKLASSMRGMKQWLFTPKQDTREQLIGRVNYYVIAAALSDWDRFDCMEPDVVEVPPKWYQRVGFFVRGFFIAVAPFAMLESYTVWQPKDPIAPAFWWGAALWGGFNLLNPLDPNLSARVTVFKDASQAISFLKDKPK